MSSASSFGAGTGGCIDATEHGHSMDVCALEEGPQVELNLTHYEVDAAKVLLALQGMSSDNSGQGSVISSADTSEVRSDPAHRDVCNASISFNHLCNLSFDAMAVLEARNDEWNQEHTKLTWWNPEFGKLAGCIGNGDVVRGSFELERSVLRSCVTDGAHQFALSSTTIEIHSRSRRVWIDEQNSIIFWVMCAHVDTHVE